MASKQNPMNCSKCGAVMNEHAERAFDPRSLEEVQKMDVALGGVVYEVHSCPACGASASRVAV